MELPPGFRGYGVKNYIENPESAKRQAEVDAIRAKMEAAGADRFAIQDASCPTRICCRSASRARTNALMNR